MAKTLADLRSEIAAKYGRYKEGTATGGTTTTLEDTAVLTQPDQVWRDHYLYIVDTTDDNAPEAEERRISSSLQANNELTVALAFTAAVGAGDLYQVYPVPIVELEEAIREAMQWAAGAWLVPEMDTTTVTIAADDYDYTLPTDLVYLNKVWRRSATTEPWQRVTSKDWSVTDVWGAQVLQFLNHDHVVVGEALRLDYYKRLVELTADTDELGLGAPMDDELIRALKDYAVGFMHERAASRAPDRADIRARITLADRFMGRAEQQKMAASGTRAETSMKRTRWSKPRR